MIDRGKHSVLGVGVNAVDYEGAVHRIIAHAREKKALSVTALAVHGVMSGVLDPVQKYRLNHLGLVTPDGQPVRWALRLLHGERLPDRVYGPRLMLEICKAATREGLAIFLFGSGKDVIDELAANLGRQFPPLQIVGAAPSRFRQLTERENADLDAIIRSSGADIVFVGLGCPRQEVFAFEHANALQRPVIAVGAAFDFHAGRLAQAPRWMQSVGLEWLFRLVVEPRRLWRRYLYLSPLYCALIVFQKLGLLKARLEETKEPVAALRYG